MNSTRDIYKNTNEFVYEGVQIVIKYKETKNYNDTLAAQGIVSVDNGDSREEIL